MASLRWVLQLHKDVPKAAKLYSQGLGFTIDVCTHSWAELHSGHLKVALLHSPVSPDDAGHQFMSFTVEDISSAVAKLMALGAQLDGPIRHEIHGKVCVTIVAAVKDFDGHIFGLYEPI